MDETDGTESATRIFIIVAGIILTAIFLFIIFGIKHEPPKPNINSIEYNFFKFDEIAGFWETDIELDGQLYHAVFRNNPKQTEDVYIKGNFTGFKTKPIYITFDPESSTEQFKYLALGTTELALHLVRALNFSIEAACTKNVTDACYNRSIVNCGDENKSVIYLVSEAPTQITLSDSCITLSGQDFELIRSVDRLLYQWYKIIR